MAEKRQTGVDVVEGVIPPKLSQGVQLDRLGERGLVPPRIVRLPPAAQTGGNKPPQK